MAGSTTITAGRAYVRLFADSSEYVKGLRAAEAKLTAFGNKVGTLGRQMAAMAAAAAAPIAFSARTFAAFEDQMLAVQAVSRATREEFGKLYDQAKQLGASTSFTAAEVAGGQLSLARQGFNPSEIEKAIPSVLNLARATGTDLAMSADIASGTLRAFNLDASEMARVADVMVATANNSAQTLEDLGESMKYAAPIAVEYGLSIEQTSKALGVMANMQIKGTMAGTSLRQIMLQLADTGVQEQLRAIGVEALDATGNLRPLGDVMLDIGKAMAGMPNAERISLGKALFDQRAVGGALKLISSDFDGLSKAIENAAGVAERTAGIMDSGLGGRFRILKSAVEAVQIAIGEALTATLTEWGVTSTDLAGKTREWIEKNQDLVVTVTEVIAAVGAAGFALIAFGAAAKGVAAAIGAATIVLQGFELACNLLAANPVAGTLIAIGLAAQAVALAYNNMESHAIRAANGLDHLATAQGRALASGDELRQEDMRLISRLDELQKKAGLTNDEMDEAATIIETLDSRHAGLGLSLNRTTGEIKGVETAYDSLAKAIARNAERELQQAIKEQIANAQTLGEAIEDVRNSWMTLPQRESMISELTLEMEMADNKAKALLERLKDIKKGNLAGALGTDAGAGPGAAVTPVTPDPAVDLEPMMTPAEEAELQRWIEDRRRRAEELTKHDESIADQLTRARIERDTPEGPERERAILEFERGKDLAEADRIGADKSKIWELYDLKLAKIDAREAARVADMGGGAWGSYSAAAAWRQAIGGKPEDKVAKKTDEVKQAIKDQEGILKDIERNTRGGVMGK